MKDSEPPVLVIVAGMIVMILGLGLPKPFTIDKANQKLALIIGAIIFSFGLIWAVLEAGQASNKPANTSEVITPTPAITTPSLPGELRRITFDYEDDPSKHGWKIQHADLLKLLIESDQRFGKILQIKSADKLLAYLDYAINADAKAGTRLDIVAKIDGTTSFYAFVLLVDQNGKKHTKVGLDSRLDRLMVQNKVAWSKETKGSFCRARNSIGWLESYSCRSESVGTARMEGQGLSIS